MNEAKILEKIKKLKEDGETYADIAEKLNVEGVRTASGLKFNAASARYLVIKEANLPQPTRRIVETPPPAEKAAPIVFAAPAAAGPPPMNTQPFGYEYGAAVPYKPGTQVAAGALTLTPKNPTEEKLDLAAKILQMKHIPLAKRADMAVSMILY